MKGLKLCALIAAAAILFAPAVALAKGPRFSFSFNIVDGFARFCPPPVERVYVCPPPPCPVIENRTIVKEYHYVRGYPRTVIYETPYYYYAPFAG